VFSEFWILRQDAGRESLLGGSDALYDSEEWLMRLDGRSPSRSFEETIRYGGDVCDRVAELMLRPGLFVTTSVRSLFFTRTCTAKPD